MKRMEVGVRKVEMWEVENWSVRLRYLVIRDRSAHWTVHKWKYERGGVHHSSCLLSVWD